MQFELKEMQRRKEAAEAAERARREKEEAERLAAIAAAQPKEAEQASDRPDSSSPAVEERPGKTALNLCSCTNIIFCHCDVLFCVFTISKILSLK